MGKKAKQVLYLRVHNIDGLTAGDFGEGIKELV